MNKRELEGKLGEINTQLKTLGDLSILLQQSQTLPGLINDAQAKKSSLETILNEISTPKTELGNLVTEAKNLIEQISLKEQKSSELASQIESLQIKVGELIEEAKAQLGIAANAKLASTFEQVKTDLTLEKTKMFNWLVAVVAVLSLATGVIVWWQIKETGTLYHLSFPVRITLLSPIIYFVIFINREYSRARNLIEEYTFKAAIARSFEAYREIVKSADSEDSTKTLDFILKSITDLYSSPMVNIKNNKSEEKEDGVPILSLPENIKKLSGE